MHAERTQSGGDTLVPGRTRGRTSRAALSSLMDRSPCAALSLSCATFCSNSSACRCAASSTACACSNTDARVSVVNVHVSVQQQCQRCQAAPTLLFTPFCILATKTKYRQTHRHPLRVGHLSLGIADPFAQLLRLALPRLQRDTSLLSQLPQRAIQHLLGRSLAALCLQPSLQAYFQDEPCIIDVWPTVAHMRALRNKSNLSRQQRMCMHFPVHE